MISNARNPIEIADKSTYQAPDQAIDQTVLVSVNWAGEPVKFSWQGITYAVIAKPTRWFDRRQWWVEAGRVQRGIGAQVLEVEMWRVIAERQVGLRTAENQSNNQAQFELMHSKDSWRLITASNAA